MADNIPTHYSEEKNKGMVIVGIGAACTLILLLHTIQFAPMLGWFFTQDFTADTWSKMGAFMGHFYSPVDFVEDVKYVGQIDITMMIVGFVITILVGVIPAVVAFAANPYRLFDLIHGDARAGTIRDVRQMEAREQVGIEGGNHLHLGKWKGSGEAMRLIETLSVLVLAPPGTGKCLAPDEKIIMADGTIGINGDLRAGDRIMGPDGTPRNILLANRGFGPMYRITPNKGRTWECNGDHILVLRKSRQPLKGLVREVTVNDWLTWNDWEKSQWKLFRAELDFAERDVPRIDPYFVGLLLGDGTTTSKIGVHTADEKIADHVYAIAATYGLQVREEFQEGNASVFYAVSAGNTKGLPRKGKNPLRDDVFAAGMRASCNEKSIPLEYKTGSRETRLQVLAGIIDTDGSYDRAGKGYDLVSGSAQLIEDVAFIARSLGFAAYPKPCEKTATNTGATGTYHRIFISGDVTQIPVRLDRRIPQKRQMNKEVTNVGFKIDAIGDGEWHGIIIDGDHQFLLDDFTVTHNTATFVVPSIITTDGSSFIVNDPKPELFDMTSGWRAQIGHVFKIDWSATDKTKDANGNWLDPEDMVFYPRFNVLSPKLTPPAGTAERDTYLDAVANVMAPSAKGGGKSDYFEEKGRAGMVGFLHYICSKVNDARDYSGLPEEWHGREACIPMIIDMINEGLILASQENDRKKEEAQASGGFHQGDALSDWLKAIVAECRENHYNPRAATEITPLISMAPNERSGIMGTMDKAFIPFKNAAVRERTMSCDFVPADLRGIVDPKTGEMKPVTLYVCVNQAEAAAFATITSLLYEVFSREFLAYGPGEINRNNVKLGPYPVCFMLDEFAKLPRIEAVMTGPDLGRSKKTYYCLVAQSDAQIGKLYSKEDQQIMYATTAVKYILPQNDKETVGLVKAMVGPTTIKKNNKSMSRGGDMKEWGKSNVSIAFEKVDFIRDGDVSGMKPGTHMLICQGFMNRPFWMDSVFYFKDPHIAPKVRARGHGPMPAPPLPDFIRQQRIEEWKRENPDALPEVRIHVPGMGAMPAEKIDLKKVA